MANEISVHGRKKMSTLQKEFSEKFEYLTLCFIIDADKDKSCSVKGIDTSKSLAETRKKIPKKKSLFMVAPWSRILKIIFGRN